MTLQSLLLNSDSSDGNACDFAVLEMCSCDSSLFKEYSEANMPRRVNRTPPPQATTEGCAFAGFEAPSHNKNNLRVFITICSDRAVCKNKPIYQMLKN